MIGIYYSVTACIRRQEGYCCVQYQVCANVINGFTLSGNAAIAILDSLCSLDYVSIPGKHIPYKFHVSISWVHKNLNDKLHEQYFILE